MLFRIRGVLVETSHPDKQNIETLLCSALDKNFISQNIENFIDNIFTIKVLIVFLQHFHQTLVF